MWSATLTRNIVFGGTAMP